MDNSEKYIVYDTYIYINKKIYVIGYSLLQLVSLLSIAILLVLVLRILVIPYLIGVVWLGLKISSKNKKTNFDYLEYKKNALLHGVDFHYQDFRKGLSLIKGK